MKLSTFIVNNGKNSGAYIPKGLFTGSQDCGEL